MIRVKTVRTLRVAIAALPLAAMPAVWGCSRDVQALSPREVEQQYGVSGAYAETLTTSDGSLRGTVVPITLPDGRAAHLVIPTQRAREPHKVYLRDSQGLHPVQIADHADRASVSRSPGVVARQAEASHPRKRSWEKEALIIGGGAGAGAAIGAVAGGKKGAAVGATAGGIGGLIYDLATRKK